MRVHVDRRADGKEDDGDLGRLIDAESEHQQWHQREVRDGALDLYRPVGHRIA
jgi:hypothetical protein